MRPEEIAEEIAGYVDAPHSARFEELARAAFRCQYERIASYRRLCRSLGVSPETVNDWRLIPAVPVAAFKTLELRVAPAIETFRSSGTTGADRSVHGHPFPDLYRRVVDRTFPEFCLDRDEERPAMLALIPPRSHIEDSSLGFMVDHLLRRFGGSGSRYAFGPGGVDVAAAEKWCRDRRGAAEPSVLILATSFALAQWLEALAESGTRLRLPAGSRIFDTGGFKGRTREVAREELLTEIYYRLGISTDRVVREYGMTELTSQFYTGVLNGGDPEVLTGPPWLRARILDPITLTESPPGQPGIVAIFDLANVGSAVHLLTQDLGVQAEPGGFRLLGRAAEAELRGCSLTVELLEHDTF